MNRFSINDMINMPYHDRTAIYKDQIVVLSAKMYGVEMAKNHLP